MSDFVEAVIALIPFDLGGRASAIYPRHGTYRPLLQTPGGQRVPIVIIEGPPSIAPGHQDNVVIEVETLASLAPGVELDIIEDGRCVGILRVERVCRAIPA